MGKDSPRTGILESAAVVVAAGAVFGLVAAMLEVWGNPPNMGICVVCFERDIVGGLGLGIPQKLRYLRPEIMGIFLGAFAGALLAREFRVRGARRSVLDPAILYGICASIGALVFMGCTWRMLCRLSGLDLTALVGLAGLLAGVGLGGWLQHLGYRPPALVARRAWGGFLLPAVMLALLALGVLEPKLWTGGPVQRSATGPGAKSAPLLLSLGGGLLIGVLAQRTRFCTIGAIRNLLFGGRRRLLFAVLAFVGAGLAVKLATGSLRPGYELQPLAHSDVLWNFLGMLLAGLAFTLAGGCPARQLVLAAEGNLRAGEFVVGAFVGVWLAHALPIAALPDRMVKGALATGGPPIEGRVAVGVGIAACVLLGLLMRRRRGE